MSDETSYTVRIDGLSAYEAADALAGALREVAHGITQFGGPMRLTFAVGPSGMPLVVNADLTGGEGTGPDHVIERLAEALEQRPSVASLLAAARPAFEKAFTDTLTLDPADPATIRTALALALDCDDPDAGDLDLTRKLAALLLALPDEGACVR